MSAYSLAKHPKVPLLISSVIQYCKEVKNLLKMEFKKHCKIDMSTLFGVFRIRRA